MRATELIPPMRRAAVFKHRILTFRFRRWRLSLGLKLRGQLAPALSDNECAAGEWLQLPFEGEWNFEI